MDAVSGWYGGRAFEQRVVGEGPYFGRYCLVAEPPGASDWQVLPKSWPTEQLALDDATGAAHFAIDAGNYNRAATLAIEAAARVMVLNSEAVGWSAAVQAQAVAARERNALETKLLGAKERHWPDFRLHAGRQSALRGQ